MIALGWFVAGIALLIVGAEVVVRRGSMLAARLGVPPMVIGVTIVAIGTSAPELASGIEAALEGNGSLAVGNVAGTNTVNILFILGLSAAIDPLTLTVQTLRSALPLMVTAALVLLAMAWDGVLSRAEGLLLVAGAVLYSTAIVYSTRRESRAVRAEFAQEYGTPRRGYDSREVVTSLAALTAGIVTIVVGADWLVDGAVDLARLLGVSDAFIGLTIVAIGTSSPELVTAVVATMKKERDIAVGNLLGSSVYNIVLILGVTCLVPSSGILVEPALVRVDIPVMTAVALVAVPVFVSGRQVSRLEGALFVSAYIAYLAYLVLART